MNVNVGDRVQVDLTGLNPVLQRGCIMPAVVKRIEGENRIVVQVTPVNGQSEFTVDPSRIVSVR